MYQSLGMPNNRKNKNKGDETRENNQKAPLLTQETMVAEIRDHPDHHRQRMTLNQVMTVQITVVWEAKDKAPHGDQNELILLTHK